MYGGGEGGIMFVRERGGGRRGGRAFDCLLHAVPHCHFCLGADGYWGHHDGT